MGGRGSSFGVEIIAAGFTIWISRCRNTRVECGRYDTDGSRQPIYQCREDTGLSGKKKLQETREQVQVLMITDT